jgi:flagellar motor protein MotB
MKRPKKATEEGKPPVPTYIVTFSDMVTLLLTFFVLLISLASKQDESLRNNAESSIRRAFANFGISGFMIGKHSGPSFEYPTIKYRINEGQDESEDRSIDAQMEMLRRTLLDIERIMEISPSQIVGISKTFTVADIHFKRGSWSLDEPAKQFLTKYCGQLQESFAAQAMTLYVVGLASGERSAKQQWLVSARRAEAVAGFIKGSLGEQSDWFVYCWGAGTGGDWSGATGLISKEADITIVTLTEK